VGTAFDKGTVFAAAGAPVAAADVDGDAGAAAGAASCFLQPSIGDVAATSAAHNTQDCTRSKQFIDRMLTLNLSS
jgi:hypothetical protein